MMNNINGVDFEFSDISDRDDPDQGAALYSDGSDDLPLIPEKQKVKKDIKKKKV